MGEFGSFGHLAKRFFGALDPRGPRPADEAWAVSLLLPGEQDLWRRMSGPDRRHAIGVARDVTTLLGETPGREVSAAALLHDVGKVESGYGTFSRVFVTFLALAVGRERLTRLSAPSRIRLYLTHDRLGGDMLRQAGSEPLTFSWAAEHHLDPSKWTVDRRLADALKAADGD
jgi:HD domain